MAGYTNLVTIKKKGNSLYKKINSLGDDTKKVIGKIFADDAIITGKGSLFMTHFPKDEISEITNASDVAKCDSEKVYQYHFDMIANDGIFFLPGKLGAFSDTKKNNLVIPGKIVEAFLFGKPVVTAKTNYIENNCSDSVIAIHPDNSMELTKAIKTLSTDEKLREDIVSKSKNYFQSNHSKDYFKNRLVKFLT